MVAKARDEPDSSPRLTADEVEARIRSLETEFRADKVKNANNLVDLIGLISPTHPTTAKAIHSGRRVIKALEKMPAETLRMWLADRRSQYAEALGTVIADGKDEDTVEAAIAAAALTHPDVWRSVLREAVSSRSAHVKDLIRDFVSRFDDLRLTAMQLVADDEGDVQARLDILLNCVGSGGEYARDKVTQKDLRRAFTTAWLAVLRAGLQPEQMHDILRRIPTELIPNMNDPLRLADFLTACYNDTSDVSVAINALDGLFVLVSRHSLDYPLFYQKLYALMSEQALFYADGRKRFLELTATFLLHGGMLPGGMVAAFVKRLVRRALIAPTTGALWCLRLALDLLYTHPSISYLVHRSVNLFEAGAKSGTKRKESDPSDPFDDDALDPQSSRADESSLWELQVLSKHISPAVSRLVTAFSKDVRKNPAPPPGTLADYAALDFEDIFQAEIKRKIKSAHLSYEKPGAAPRLLEHRKRMKTSLSWT